MTRPKTAIHDAATGVTEIREMTDEELAAYEALQAESSPLPDTTSNPS